MIRPSLLLACLALAGAALSAHAQAPFKDVVIFGDSLSDVGNIADRTEDDLDLRYPSPDFGYTDGRFTNGKDSDPAARRFEGVWHEQLLANYFSLPRLKPSLEGGTDYAFGGGKTTAGSTKRSVFDDPIFGNEIEITIDDMGKQVGDYLASHTPSPDTLYVLWGGANDILENQDSATVQAAAANVRRYIKKLGKKGATQFLVVNVPPIGMVPNYSGKSNAAALNAACAEYATDLSAAADSVQAQLLAKGFTVTIHKLDIYDLFMRYLTNPAAYGLIDVDHLAQDEDVNPDKYLFWDGLHPTTRGHSLIAAEAFTAITGTPVVSINTTISEFKETDGKALYYLTRTGLDLSASLTVPITSVGTATAGADFKPKSAKVMPPEKAFKALKIAVLDDTEKEHDEELTLQISANAGYVLGFPFEASVTLKSDD